MTYDTRPSRGPSAPRWKAEADACIARHGLRVYGDPWTPTTEGPEA
jgi:hypothetical protein